MVVCGFVCYAMEVIYLFLCGINEKLTHNEYCKRCLSFLVFIVVANFSKMPQRLRLYPGEKPLIYTQKIASLSIVALTFTISTRSTTTLHHWYILFNHSLSDPLLNVSLPPLTRPPNLPFAPFSFFPLNTSMSLSSRKMQCKTHISCHLQHSANSTIWFEWYRGKWWE